VPDYRGSEQRQRDYASVFSDEQGQRVLDDIMAYCHIKQPLADADPNANLVRCGRTDVANMILSAIDFKPQQHRETKNE